MPPARTAARTRYAATAALLRLARFHRKSLPSAAPLQRRPSRLFLRLTCSLTLAIGITAGILIRLDQQRRTALLILQHAGAQGRVWHHPAHRQPIPEPADLAAARSHFLLYPSVIATHGIPPHLSAALQVLQPRLLIITTDAPIPASFWAELSPITSLCALQITTRIIAPADTPPRPAFIDTDLQSLSQLTQLRALTLHGSSITLAGLRSYLQSAPQLSSLRLTRIQQPTPVPSFAGASSADLQTSLTQLPPPITHSELRSLLIHHPHLSFHLDGQAVIPSPSRS